MNIIQDKLNELWAGVIESYEINILNHIITFQISVLENNKKTNYCVSFKEVSSYHFYADSDEQRLNLTEPDEEYYSELSSIDYYDSGIGKIKTIAPIDRPLERYYSSANFVLEIWNSVLFIEAKGIIINDIEYDVKYPYLEG